MCPVCMCGRAGTPTTSYVPDQPGLPDAVAFALPVVGHGFDNLAGSLGCRIDGWLVTTATLVNASYVVCDCWVGLDAGGHHNVSVTNDGIAYSNTSAFWVFGTLTQPSRRTQQHSAEPQSASFECVCVWTPGRWLMCERRSTAGADPAGDAGVLSGPLGNERDGARVGVHARQPAARVLDRWRVGALCLPQRLGADVRRARSGQWDAHAAGVQQPLACLQHAALSGARYAADTVLG